jgi:hypothetical protein
MAETSKFGQIVEEVMAPLRSAVTGFGGLERN